MHETPVRLAARESSVIGVVRRQCPCWPVRLMSPRGAAQAAVMVVSCLFAFAGHAQSNKGQDRRASSQSQETIAEQALGTLPQDDIVTAQNGQFVLPPGHPASVLREGTYRSVDGVVIALQPVARTGEVRFAGLPDLFLRGSLPQDIESCGNNQEGTFTTAVAKRFATYYAQQLTSSQKGELIALYRNEISAACRIVSQTHVDTEAKLNDVRNELAQLLSRSFIEEMNWFAGKPQAKMRRFPGWSGRRLEDTKDFASFLTQAYLELLTGTYIRRDEQAIAPEQTNLDSDFFVASEPLAASQNIKYESSGRQSFDVFLEAARGRARSHSPRVQAGTSLATYAWEARVYTSEHSILSNPLESRLTHFVDLMHWPVLGSDLGLVHVSVVAGVWRLTRQAGTGQTTKLGGKWYRWVVADGSASWIQSDDKLVLRERAVFPSYEAAVKYLLGSAEDSKGFDPVHECAYSVGDYGRNWVCHQNSNAYALDKWGLILVNYPTSLVFGPVGNYVFPALSLRKDPWNHRLYDGGAPGKELHYQTDLPYAIVDNVLNGFMRQGSGYGLGVGWDSHDSQWQPTGCLFTPQNPGDKIPAGPDDRD